MFAPNFTPRLLCPLRLRLWLLGLLPADSCSPCCWGEEITFIITPVIAQWPGDPEHQMETLTPHSHPSYFKTNIHTRPIRRDSSNSSQWGGSGTMSVTKTSSNILPPASYILGWSSLTFTSEMPDICSFWQSCEFIMETALHCTVENTPWTPSGFSTFSVCILFILFKKGFSILLMFKCWKQIQQKSKLS